MDKSPDAFRTISEVADVLETPAHVLRFWESRFPQIKPVKRAGGRRYYRPSDVALLAGIKRLLHDEGLTIRGVQKILRDQGARHVAGLSDESVELDGMFGEAGGIDDAALLAAIDVPEAEETAPVASQAQSSAEPEAVAGADAGPSDQPQLSLFSGKIDPGPVTRKADRIQTSTLGLVGLIRSLPRGALTQAQPELELLVQRLARHRARVAERAEGGQG